MPGDLRPSEPALRAESVSSLEFCGCPTRRRCVWGLLFVALAARQKIAQPVRAGKPSTSQRPQQPRQQRGPLVRPRFLIDMFQVVFYG